MQLKLHGSDDSHAIQSCVINICNEDIGKLINMSGELHVTVQDTDTKEITYKVFNLENNKYIKPDKQIDGVKERTKNFVLQ